MSECPLSLSGLQCGKSVSLSADGERQEPLSGEAGADIPLLSVPPALVQSLSIFRQSYSSGHLTGRSISSFSLLPLHLSLCLFLGTPTTFSLMVSHLQITTPESSIVRALNFERPLFPSGN